MLPNCFKPAGYQADLQSFYEFFPAAMPKNPLDLGGLGQSFFRNLMVDWIHYILTSFSVLDMPVRAKPSPGSSSREPSLNTTLKAPTL